jgi:hypothetical protein
MLAWKRPNNHDYIYKILKNISRRDLGEHSVGVWH